MLVGKGAEICKYKDDEAKFLTYDALWPNTGELDQAQQTFNLQIVLMPLESPLNLELLLFFGENYLNGLGFIGDGT